MYDIFTWDYCDRYKFQDMYDKIVKWKSDNDRFPYYKSEDVNERMLANWCDYQRAMKNANDILPDHKYKLEQIEGWNWKEGFDIFYNELVLWINKYDKLPHQSTSDVYERRLATWCSSVRRKKRKNSIDDYHIKLLDNLEGWFWNRFGNSFQSLFELLKKFVDIHKRYPLEITDDNNEKKLFKLYNKQRKLPSTLSDENKKQLESLPDWSWIDNNDKTVIFNNKYESIKKWVDCNHRIPSPTSEFPLEKQLGRICKTFRTNKEQLTDEMIKKIDQIDGWYWSLYDYYHVSLDEIRKWVNDSP